MKLLFPIKNVFPVKTTFPAHLVCQPKPRGLGDVVAMVAESIKHGLQKILPSNLANKLNDCGCDKRRTAMNKMFPLKKR